MATLHLVNKSPTRSDGLDACLRVFASGDVLLLIEDGVYAALAGTEPARRLAGSTCYALAADLAARGLEGRTVAGVETVDDAGFVQLCERCHRVMSWF